LAPNIFQNGKQFKIVKFFNYLKSVPSLATTDDAISANGGTRPSDGRADPTVFSEAGGGTTIAADAVAVFAEEEGKKEG
jgi:hypothetical protein